MTPIDDQNIQCPFCGEDGFDLIGLKKHLLGFLIFNGCEAFQEVTE